jgi:hypothetical protein
MITLDVYISAFYNTGIQCCAGPVRIVQYEYCARQVAW